MRDKLITRLVTIGILSMVAIGLGLLYSKTILPIQLVFAVLSSVVIGLAAFSNFVTGARASVWENNGFSWIEALSFGLITTKYDQGLVTKASRGVKCSLVRSVVSGVVANLVIVGGVKFGLAFWQSLLISVSILSIFVFFLRTKVRTGVLVVSILACSLVTNSGLVGILHPGGLLAYNLSLGIGFGLALLVNVLKAFQPSQRCQTSRR